MEKSKIPEDGRVLQLGHLYLKKMDTIDKGAISNFKAFISVMDRLEPYRHPIDHYLYKLAMICNQYGIGKERTYDLITEEFRLNRAVHEAFPEFTDFKAAMKMQIDDVYSKFASVHDSWHFKEDDERAETPILPEHVYAGLPPVLRSLASYFTPGRERDVFTLSSLGVLSSCFPEVQGNYDNCMVGINLYMFISAPASAGKGVMVWARRLAEEMHKDCESRYRQATDEYEQAMQECKAAGEDGQEKSLPVKPERQLFFIPANSSASKVIQTMKANKNFGVILDTEADTLSQALGNDWGNFSDTLRKAFHHEPIELQRKLNDEYVSIEKSFLSVVLSGTPDQIKNLLSSVENGFFSRFLFYDFPLSLEWKNVFDEQKEAPDGIFASVSEQLLRYSKQISQLASENGGDVLPFKFTATQQAEFNKWFSEKQGMLHHLFGDQIIASLRRMGLITFRIAMLLTVLRHIKDDIPTQFTCCDTDFNVAKSITDTLICHLTKVFNQLQRMRKMKTAGGRKALYLEKLPDAFQRAGAMEIAAMLNIKEKTAENYLSGLIQSGLLERVEHNQYQKV